MKKVLIALIIIALICPLTASAVVFNNGYIISDSDLMDYKAMTLTEIQSFLAKKAGLLDVYQTPDKNGISRSAAEIIYNAAQEHKINPQFLLVMLQKEQSLVQDFTPSPTQYDWAMGYGVCDSCDMNSPSLLLHKGFGTQVDSAAAVQRWYIDNVNNGWLKQPGKTYVIDGHSVYISNQATANLYNFTPHIHGNYNFWKIWNRWFTQRYPDGTLLQGEGEPGVWLIQNDERRPFHSKGALVSRYDINKIIVVSRNELEKYEVGASIKFANYSLLQTPMGNVYLLANDKLKKFESSEVLRTLGFNPEEFEGLSLDEFANYELGEPITLSSAYPAGALLQDNTTGGVYYVQDGKKYPLISRDIMKVNYSSYRVTPVSPEELEKYPRQDTVKLRDGEIVRSANSPSVYIISNGTKRPVVSGDIFERLGYKWENVRFVETRTLSNLPLGSYVDLDFKL